MGVTNLTTDDYNRKITKLLGLFHTQDKNAQRFQVGVTPGSSTAYQADLRTTFVGISFQKCQKQLVHAC